MSVLAATNDIQSYTTDTHWNLPAGNGVMKVLAKSGVKAVPVFAVTLSLVLLLSLLAIRWAGWDTYTLKGSSMEPTFSPGSLILTCQVPAEDLRAGDVTVFSAPWAKVNDDSVLVVHRLIDVSPAEGGFRGYTQGDGNNAIDPSPTLFSGRVDTVQAAVPFMGYVYSFIDDWGAVVTLLGIWVLLILLALSLIHNWRSAIAGQMLRA